MLAVADSGGIIQEIQEKLLPGTFIRTIANAGSGMAIMSLVPAMAPMILVATSEGASVGSYLSIYAVRYRSLQDLAGVSIEGSSLEVVCAEGKQPCRLLAWGKWTDETNATISVYEWNGWAFVRDDAAVNSYVENKLAALSREASLSRGNLDSRRLYPGMRVSIGRLVVARYLTLHESGAAMNAADGRN